MARRVLGPLAQERGPRAGPWRSPRLPELVRPAPRGPRAAGGAWWQDRAPEPGAPARPAARSPSLPPLLSAGGPRGSRSWSGEAPAPLGGPWEPPDSLGGLLGELLPSRFRDFLRELQAKCADAPGPQTQTRGHGPPHLRSPGLQCPTRPFLPDLWHPRTHCHHLPPGQVYPQPVVVGVRGDCPRFSTMKTANLLHGAQVPKINTVLIHGPGGGPAPRRRRHCPFRVRFEDETVRDSERRYWERSCAVYRSGLEEAEPPRLPEGSVPRRVLRNVGRWLESLPKAVYPRLKEAMSCSSHWERSGGPRPEPQPYLSKASLHTRLPFISRARDPRPRPDYQTFLDAYGSPCRAIPAPCSCTHRRESFLPSLVLQSFLKRGRL